MPFILCGYQKPTSKPQANNVDTDDAWWEQVDFPVSDEYEFTEPLTEKQLRGLTCLYVTRPATWINQTPTRYLKPIGTPKHIVAKPYVRNSYGKNTESRKRVRQIKSWAGLNDRYRADPDDVLREVERKRRRQEAFVNGRTKDSDVDKDTEGDKYSDMFDDCEDIALVNELLELFDTDASECEDTESDIFDEAVAAGTYGFKLDL